MRPKTASPVTFGGEESGRRTAAAAAALPPQAHRHVPNDTRTTNYSRGETMNWFGKKKDSGGGKPSGGGGGGGGDPSVTIVKLREAVATQEKR